MNRPSHSHFVKKALKNPEVKAEYDRLMLEHEVVSEFIKARKKAKKTQQEVAEFMKTTASVISRLENAGSKKHPSPSLETLRKYAYAIGCTLEIKLKPAKSKYEYHNIASKQ